MPSDPALDAALAIAGPVIATDPAGLLTDIDGTLAPIVRDPDAVRLAAGAPEALEALAERLAVVALVTGRAAADARRIAGLPALGVAGNHGTEWLPPHAVEPEPDPRAAEVSARLDEALRHVPSEPGIEVEHKGLSATIHYRGTSDPAAARERLVASLGAALPRELILRHGRMSIELRPAALGDKGSAVRAIVERYGLRGVVVLGDDVTDLDMFRAADVLRRAGTIRAAILAVGSDGEVPDEVRAAADAVLAGPAEVVALLERL